MAVGQQAADALDRIAAQEIARRRESLAALGELSAGLAHEVRNPVAAIRGAAQASGPDATPEQRGEMLEVIEEETARLERVVREFLDYARPTPPRREAVTVERVVQRVVQGAALAGWTLETRIDVAPETPDVLADPDQLQRVFENLVRNTWEATGPGGRLHIDIRPAGANLVATRFEDNGPGIAPERLQHIFTPFHTTKPSGTGLGLALVHRVVEAHGGEVRAEGREGRGAAFTIVLAAAPPSP
jgi:two-component system sensor histidine kinase HydH